MVATLPVADADLLGEGIQRHLAGDLSAARSAYQAAGLGYYDALTETHQRLQQYCQRRAVCLPWAQRGPVELNELRPLLLVRPNPLGHVFLIISHGTWKDVPNKEVDEWIDRAFQWTRLFDARLFPILMGWCHYAKALTAMRRYSAFGLYNRSVATNYVFSLTGRERPRFLECQTALLREAQRAVWAADCWAVAMTDPVLGGLLRQIQIAIDLRLGNRVPVPGDSAQIEALTPGELLAYSVAAQRQDEGPECIERLLAVAARHLGPEYSISSLDISDASQITGGSLDKTALYAGGTRNLSMIILVDGQMRREPLQMQYPEMALYDIDECMICDGHGLIVAEGKILEPSLSIEEWNVHVNCSDVEGGWLHQYQFLHTSLVPTQRQSTVVLPAKRYFVDVRRPGARVLALVDVCPTMVNHAHWLLDGLLRIAAVKARIDQPIQLCFVHQPTTFQIDSLLAIGIAKEDLIMVPIDDRPYTLRGASFVLPTAFSASTAGADIFCVNPDAVLNLRVILGNLLPKTQASGSRVYLSRSTRGVLNESEYLPDLQAFGIEEVVIEGKSFAAHVTLFYHADLLISVGGAGLANMIFMRPGTVVIGIYHEYFMTQMYANLADILGIKYITLVGQPSEFNGPLGVSPMRVEPGALRSALRECGFEAVPT